MKNITLMLVFIGMISLQSCTVSDSPAAQQITNNNNFLATTLEYTRSFTAGNNFSTLVTFPQAIYSSDMVLVYRLSSVYQGQDVWKLLPENFYLNNGTLDFGYNFDFTKNDASIYMIGNDLGTINSSYLNNQVLRVVIIPANFGNKTINNINYMDYNAVAKAYNIEESKVLKIK